MRLIDADVLIRDMEENPPSYGDMDRIIAAVNNAPTVVGWINNYEWICPVCGSSILVKTFKQRKVIGMKLSECPVCGKEVLYGKAD